MNELRILINELESNIPNQKLINPSVSKSSVGWHIEHSLLSVKLMIEGLKNSNPENYKWKFNISRIFIMTMNKIPRGKGIAPEISLPENEYNESTMIKNISFTNDMIKEIDKLEPCNFIEHPYFGHMNLKATKKLLILHTVHHIEIIKDIIRSDN